MYTVLNQSEDFLCKMTVIETTQCTAVYMESSNVAIFPCPIIFPVSMEVEYV